MSNEKTVLDRLDDMIDELVILRKDIEKAFLAAAETPEGTVPEELYDAEKERISSLVSENPDLYIDNPELYEQMAPYADENKPPFNSQSWQMVVMGRGDSRLTYEQIAEFEENMKNKTAPWDDLRKDADS